MAVRPRGDGWQVDVCVKGVRAPRLTFASKAEALAVEARFKADLLAGRPVSDPQRARGAARRQSATTLADLLDLTVRTRWRGLKAAETMERNARLFVEALGPGLRTSDLSQMMIDDVVHQWASAGAEPSTINRKLSALSVMITVATEAGEPVDGIKLRRQKEYEGRIRYFSDEEERVLLSFFEGDETMRDMLILGLDTGFRESEITGLTDRDYSVSTNKLHLWETKGDEARSVPLTKRAREIVMKRRTGKGWERLFPDAYTRKQISTRMQSWKRHMGFPKDDEACFHTTRHTCCSRLVMSGTPLPVVQKWMGHKTILTTMRYAHLTPDAFDGLEKALERRHA